MKTKVGVICMVLGLLLLAAPTTAELTKVDDFESYAIDTFLDNETAPGSLGGTWDADAEKSVGFHTQRSGKVAADPADAGNQVLRQEYRHASFRAICIHDLTDPIGPSEVGVLFLRFRSHNTGPLAGWSIGAHDLTGDDPIANQQTDYKGSINAGFTLTGNASGLSITTIDGSQTLVTDLANDQWYAAWFVIDNGSDTFDLYIEEASAAAGDATLPTSEPVAVGLAFDAATDNPLTGALFAIQGASGNANFADEIWWNGSGGLVTAGAAHTPSPTGSAVDPALVNQLTWEAPLTQSDPEGDPNLVSVDQYDLTIYSKLTDDVTADDPNFVGVTILPDVTSPYAISLDYDMTYFWRVDTHVTWDSNDLTGTPSLSGIVTGSNWQFATMTAAPLIIEQPVGTRASQSDADVVLTCQFVSVSAPTVLWYEVGNATPLSTGGDIVISTVNDAGDDYTTTLQILTPALVDEGEYYCTIDNGTLLQSDAAYLIINQLLAQYDFDGTLAPAAGSLADAPTGQGMTTDGLAEPNEVASSPTALSYDTGVNGVGQAVLLDPNDFVDFSTAGYPKAGSITNGLGRGLDAGTVICWVKPNVDGAILANYNDGGTTGFDFRLSGGEARMNVRSDSGTICTDIGSPDRPGWDVFDGEWHMVAYTWESGVSSAVYVDGQPVDSGNGGSSTVFADWQRAVLLGAGRTSPDRNILNGLFDGAIDNLRIYNYRLDADGNDAFAQEYYDNTGIRPCLDSNFDGSEYNFDNTGSSYCVLNLADFAVFARAWLTNGLWETP